MKRLFVVLLFLASVAHGATFADRFKASGDALTAGDYAKALKVSDGIIRDFDALLGEGDGAEKWFAIAVAHKALALAGLGQNDEAIWQWHMALNIYPPLERSDLSMFGAAGELLKNNPLPAPPPSCPRVGDLVGKSKVTAPVVIKRIQPEYAEGARLSRVRGIAIFESIITREGVISSIRAKKVLPAPTLTYAAMQALRQWRFIPGKLDGDPVDVVFNLTINYKLE